MSKLGAVSVIAVSCCLVLSGIVNAQVTIETVVVGNPGNPSDTVGEEWGTVDYIYQIGKFEITAAQYTAFLNAVAADDPYGLYVPEMADPVGELGCNIQRSGSVGNYSYSVAPDWADRPVNYVSWGDAARFCNWLHHGQPSGPQSGATTEDGAYTLNGATTDEEYLAVVRNPQAKWAIPSDDEWHKAAYHYNDGATGNYWTYPTQADTQPTAELPPGTDMTNGSANYHNGEFLDTVYYRTEVGSYDARPSESASGTFDQGGNVREWSEGVVIGDPYSYRVVRGGDFSSGWAPMEAAGWSILPPRLASHANGMRVVRLQPAVPATSQWGALAMTLLVLATGTLVLTRTRRVFS